MGKRTRRVFSPEFKREAVARLRTPGATQSSVAAELGVAAHGMRASMSRKGGCLDNAPMESFFNSLKTELVHRTRFAIRAEAKAALFEYIEVFYNRQRLHSSLGY